MFIKSTLPFTLKQIKGMKEKGNIDLSFPIQRRSCWSNIQQKSLLVASCLQEFPIPQVFMIKEPSEVEEGKSVYRVIDGKQRIETMLAYVNDEFKLSEKLDMLEVNEEVFNVSRKLFSELNEELQQSILNYRFSIVCFENITEDQVAEIFYRLNNNVPLSKSDLARAKLGYALAQKVTDILQSSFFEKCCFTKRQIMSSDDLTSLLQSMMLLEYSDKETFPYSSISASEALNYVSDLNGIYDDERLTKAVDYLSEVVEEKSKFYKKINIPTLIVTADRALQAGMNPDVYREWLESFVDNLDYKKYCGSGSIKCTNTYNRLEIANESLNDWRGKNA